MTPSKGGNEFQNAEKYPNCHTNITISTKVKKVKMSVTFVVKCNLSLS